MKGSIKEVFELYNLKQIEEFRCNKYLNGALDNYVCRIFEKID